MQSELVLEELAMQGKRYVAATVEVAKLLNQIPREVVAGIARASGMPQHRHRRVSSS